MKKLIVFICLLMTTSLIGQTFLTVIEGDTIELRVTEVTTLVDGDPLPSGDLFVYHIHLLYEDGSQEELKHNALLEFSDEGKDIIIEANATNKVGTHKIEAWAVRRKPSGSGGDNNIAGGKAILDLIVKARIDNRPPARLIITIHPKVS
jgi:hypothetical protein